MINDSDTEENVTKRTILRQVLQHLKRVFFPFFLSGFMDVYLQWISEMMMSSEGLSHTESKTTCFMPACSHLTELRLSF